MYTSYANRIKDSLKRRVLARSLRCVACWRWQYLTAALSKMIFKGWSMWRAFEVNFFVEDSQKSNKLGEACRSKSLHILFSNRASNSKLGLLPVLLWVVVRTWNGFERSFIEASIQGHADWTKDGRVEADVHLVVKSLSVIQYCLLFAEKSVGNLLNCLDDSYLSQVF